MSTIFFKTQIISWSQFWGWRVKISQKKKKKELKLTWPCEPLNQTIPEDNSIQLWTYSYFYWEPPTTLLKSSFLIQQKYFYVIIWKFYAQSNYKLNDEVKISSEQVELSYSLSQSVIFRGEQYKDLRHSELNPGEWQREVPWYDCAANLGKQAVWENWVSRKEVS